VQTPATPELSLVAGAGKRFLSPLVGTLFLANLQVKQYVPGTLDANLMPTR
jgi:hypothetical protein